MLQGGQQFAANLFGGGAGKVVDTILTYGGPVALIMVIARYQEGFNGLGRRLMPRIRALKLIGRDEHEQHTGDAISLSLIAGAALIVAGFITIALAWHHISRTNQLWVQNQEILSGGVVGLGLILIGVGLFIRDRLARNHVLLARQLERLMGPSSAAAAAGGDIEVVDGKDDADGPRAQNVDFVAVPPALESAKPTNGRRRRARVAG
jgi:hypothetical protein